MNTGKQSFIWRLVNAILIAMITLMVALVFVNAFLRYAFNSGITAGEELSRYLFVWVSALGAIVAFKEGRHIGVDILVTALKGKAKKAVLTVGYLITLASFVLVLWGGWQYFMTSAASPGPATEIPFGFISVSIIVVALAILAMTMKDLIGTLRDKS